MKSPRHVLFVFLLLLIGTLAYGGVGDAASQAHLTYTVTVLPNINDTCPPNPPSQGNNPIGSFGYAMNNSGQVGASYYCVQGGPDNSFDATQWDSGARLQDIGALWQALNPNFAAWDSASLGINDSGAVVGWGTLSGPAGPRPFLYKNGSITDLGTLGHPGTACQPGESPRSCADGPSAGATAINNRGQVVGWSYVYPNPPTLARHAFLYDGGSMIDLGTLGGFNSFASGINNPGMIVGRADTVAGTSHAFVDTGGVMSDLGTLGGTTSAATSVNAQGQIIGWATLTDDTVRHAFLYAGSAMSDLGTLGGPGSDALSINEAGNVVGQADTASGTTHAFLYSKGTMQDLNDLVPAGTPTLASATAINKHGQILANDTTYLDNCFGSFCGSIRPGSRVYVLTPR